MPLPDPNSVPLAAALDRSESLTGLMRRLRDSRARLDTVAGLLPEALRPGVRPGPLDDAGWVLLVADPSAAAKLRQLMPALQAALLAAGWPDVPVRIKVLPRA
jgi:hypothetical protein